jgi:hypothetical protein
MSPPLSAAELASWAGLFAVLVIGSARVASARGTTLTQRWFLFFGAAALPLLAPSRGILSSLLTGFCVVFAARLPDLERERPKKSPGVLWTWLLVPMFRTLPVSPETRERNRRAVRGHVKTALGHGGLCLGLALALHHSDGHGMPSLVRSSTLILFFVGLIVGLASALTAVAAGFGSSTDLLFEAPLESKSLREFWSRRWNRFIARFALRHVARGGAASGFGAQARRTLLVFFWSGVFHEYFSWGVAGNAQALGTQFAFFVLQGFTMVAIGLWPVRWAVPPRVGQVLTFGWMAFTAPLFFESVYAPLESLGYPSSWLPDWLRLP